MNIFISYSIHDLELVRQIHGFLRPYAQVYYWDGSKVPGKEMWPSIFSWIDMSDLVLVVITGKTISRAMAVGQEIGRAKTMKKQIIPLVSAEVPASELGFLSGITYQAIDPHNPGPALGKIQQIVLEKKQQLANQQLIMLLGGIVALIWLGSGNK